MPSVYSVYGTQLHLILPDEFADAINRVTDAFAIAEQVGNKIQLTCEKNDMVSWNKFANLMNDLTEINGGTLDLLVGTAEFPSIYLVKL